MDRPLVAVVMAGGTGTRLYPASRSDRPKQLRSLGGDRSLLVRTLERAGFADRRVVLAGGNHAPGIRDHLAEAGLDDVGVLVEPEPRDTGPALVYAAHRLRGSGSESGGSTDPVLLALPSDHHVEGDFAALARHAARVAVETRGLVTVGVEPARPATGYGYIEPGREEDDYAPVRSFHEKPDEETARELIDRGCLWNAGLFAWTPTALLSAARKGPLEPLVEALDRGAPESGFAATDPVSVDYAVLERTGDAFVVPVRDLEWADLGSWDSLDAVLPEDADGNATLGEVLTVDAEDNVIASQDAHVTAIGVEDLVIAAVDDRVLVVPREEAERVREAVEELRERDLF